MTELEWVVESPAIPTRAGWYRVMHEGSSESLDGHVLYDYADYEGWAFWRPADTEEYEDFDGGYKGTWTCDHDEDGEFIIAYFGPIEIPQFPKERAKA